MGATGVYLLAAVGVLLGIAVFALKVQDGTHPLGNAVVTGVGGLEFVVAGVVAHRRRRPTGSACS